MLPVLLVSLFICTKVFGTTALVWKYIGFVQKCIVQSLK